MIVNPSSGSGTIADGSITNIKIADATISSAKLDASLNAIISAGGGSITEGSITSFHIANGTILTTDISNHAITYDKLAVDSVSNTRIINGAVTHAKLSSDCVQSHNIVDGTILGTDICGNTITSTNIANGAILRSKLSELTTNLMIYNADTSTAKLDYTINLSTAGNITNYFNYPLGALGIGMTHSLRVCVPSITTEITVVVDTDNISVTDAQVYSGGTQVGTFTDDALTFTLDSAGYDNIQIGFIITPD